MTKKKQQNLLINGFHPTVEWSSRAEKRRRLAFCLAVVVLCVTPDEIVSSFSSPRISSFNHLFLLLSELPEKSEAREAAWAGL